MIKRWLPRSLTAQLLTLLLGGLVVSHAVGLLFLSRDHGEIHPLARNKGTDMFVRVFNGVQALDAPAATAVLAAASDTRGRFLISDQATSLPASDRYAEAAAHLQTGLQETLGKSEADVRACLGEECSPEQITRVDGRTLMPMVLEARRDDGRWVQATLWTEVRDRWWWPVSFWLQASLVPIMLAVGIAMRSLIRPGRALVAASGKISRGERVEQLKVEGPREIRDIIEAFNQMQFRISRFVEDRTFILATISHDIRSPITSLRLRAELVDDDAQRLAMVRTLDEMRCMVDETLQFAREDALSEATQTVDLRQLLQQIIDDQQALGRDVRWLHKPKASQFYRCRPNALKRAFVNVVDNAVRYGHRARISLTVQQDHTICIDVDDDGPGIPPDRREAAFTPFLRLSERPDLQRNGHSGLGLPIARNCARAHGGDVQLMPAPDATGLRARLSLPIDRTEHT